MNNFLLQHYKNEELLTEVSVALKKLLEIGVTDEQSYRMALENEDFRKIVLQLPPMNGGCDLMKTDHTVTIEECCKYPSSCYILTNSALLYYNKSDNKLFTIELNKSQLEQLNSTFALPIVKLTPDQFTQLRSIAPIGEHNKQRLLLARRLSYFQHLDTAMYERFAYNNQLVSSFNKFTFFESIRKILEKPLSPDEFFSTTKNLLENKRLSALIDVRICPSIPQITQLLDPESDKSRAIDLLLSYNLKVDSAYKWAFIDTPAAENFRKTLFQLSSDKSFPPKSQAQIIEALCSLQMGDIDQNIIGKDVFSLYLDSGEKGIKFRRAISKIERTCIAIKNRWSVETSLEDTKTRSFEAAEQKYRTGLYQVVFDTLNPPNLDKVLTKKEFASNIEQVSKPMLDVVDEDKHPWIRGLMAVLLNVLNIICLTLPSRKITGRALFLAHTQSGYALRDLHEDLTSEVPPIKP
jgi:hypothetical protein